MKHFIEYPPFESSNIVNTSIIIHAVDDVLRQLGSKRENFGLLLTRLGKIILVIDEIVINYTILL